MKIVHKISLLLLCVALSVVASAKDNKKMTREEYIKTYAPLAVEQMACFGIPASITLAQGLLESSNGNSELAVNANNHFGIKCSNSWTGKSYRHDDDAPQECFRVYDSVLESYIDHSLILLERKWYQPLFSLDKKDYKAWAHGLKKAGYATNPKYADLLIEIIEKYELHKYDNALLADYKPLEVAVETPAQEVAAPEQEAAEQSEAAPATELPATETPTTEPTTAEEPEPTEAKPTEEKPTAEEKPAEVKPTEVKPAEEKVADIAKNTPQRVDVDSYTIAIERIGDHSIYSQDGRKYIVAREGDSIESLAKLLGISTRSIRRYNELDKNYTVSVGDKLFIEK